MHDTTREALTQALSEHPELIEAIGNDKYGMDFSRDPLQGPDTEGARHAADQELA